jgi:hypothetical protein
VGRFETKTDAFSMRAYRSGPPAGADVPGARQARSAREARATFRRCAIVVQFGPSPRARRQSPSSAADDERRQAKRNSLANKLTVEAKALADLKIEKAAVEGERRAVEADLGPAANPQAQAMHVNSNTMHTVQAAAMVAMCLAAGYIIAFGAGLVWPRG